VLTWLVGQRKSELKRYTLSDMVNELTTWEQGQLLKTVQELEHLISMPDFQERPWSRYVDDLWQESLKSAAGLCDQCVGTSVQGEFNVRRRKGHMHTVVWPADAPPECSCSSFKSTRIPCPDICYAAMHSGRQLFDFRNLHPRWRAKHHPLYKQALRNCNLTDGDADTSEGELQATIHPGVPPAAAPELMPAGALQVRRDFYDAVCCPSDTSRRYSILRKHFQDLELVANASDHAFKLACSALASLTHQLESNALQQARSTGMCPLARPVPGLKPPAHKRKGTHQEEEAVKRVLNETRGKGLKSSRLTQARKPGTCSACRRHDRGASDHRKGGKCPFESCRCCCPGERAHVGCACDCVRAGIPGRAIVVPAYSSGVSGAANLVAALVTMPEDAGTPVILSQEACQPASNLGFVLSR